MIPPEDLFQRVSLCETLRRVVSVYVSEIGTFTKIAAACFSVMVVTWSLVLLPMLLAVMGVQGTDFDDPDFRSSHRAEYVVLKLVSNGVIIVGAAIGGGALCRALAELYAGQRPNWIACLRVSFKKAPSLLLATLLVFLASFLGFRIVPAPGSVFLILVVLFIPPIVVENADAYRSLARSIKLVRDNWAIVTNTLLAFAFPVVVLQVLWSGLLLGSAHVGVTMFSVKGSIVAMVPALLSGPICVGAQFAIYINMRVIKEGMNLEILVNEVLGEPSSGEGPYSHVAKQAKDVGDAPLVSAV